jgi:RNA polymerase sigma-70 factor, ECF subfamily
VTDARAEHLLSLVQPIPSVEPEAARLRLLTEGLARGDDSAWESFHRDYGPQLFRQLLVASRGEHDLASEALQHAYLRIARHVRPCDVDTMFSAWLRIVARTALHDCLRKRRSFWQLLQRRHADPADKPDLSSDDTAVFDALDTALNQLDQNDRTLLEAKYLNGADIRSLATQLAISPKAVESRLTRARTELRRLLETAIRHDHETR